ncbi:MAG: ankyrin repeat domain-containing protein [Armatimonadetes bacterium]|nr:ankyrin repeat domain-containing protein [Armatimonadota bacterium]
MDSISAVKNGEVDSVREMLRQNPELAQSEQDGASAVPWAIYTGRRDIADLLIDSAIPLNIYEGSAAGRHAVRHLLQAGANPNLQAEGFTALRTAASNGDAEIARMLLAKGADTSLKTPVGQTAYDLAKAAGHEEVAQMIAGS